MDNSSEQTKLTCDVLSICMTNLIIGESVNYHSNLLEKSLNHSNPEVKLLGLNELLRIASKKPSLITDSNLVIACIKDIASKETKVGSTCVKLLSIILPNFIDIAGVKSHITDILIQSEDTIKCRIFELSINIVKLHAELIEKLEFILGKMLTEFNDSNDILFQMNILQLLSDLAISDEGLTYLENKGICSNLMKKTESCQSSLMIPGLMKFFGSIAAMHPQQIFNKYPGVTSSLFDCVIGNDFIILPTALDTIGHLAQSLEGKIYLEKVPGNKFQTVLKHLSSTITSYPSELKIRALNTLKLLFFSDTPQNNQVSSLTQSWYDQLSSAKDLNFLLQFTKNAFPDIKIAGLKLLKSVVNYRWGQEYLSQTAGFIEILLDRKIEFDKHVIHEKFEINKILSESSIFDRDTVNQLKKYVGEGVFYVETIHEVAVEGQD